MQPDKKELEILLMNYFRAFYKDFPKGQLQPSESPDFIVKMKNRHELGIEITRLNPVNKSTPDDNQLVQISLREEIIEMSRDLFGQSSDFKLFVKFLFTDTKEVQKEKQLIFSVTVVDLIRKIVKNRSRESFFKEAVSGNGLPEGLEEILVVNHPAMQFPVWERANNLGVSTDVAEDIRQSVHKKNEKLRLYKKQRLNYYWLLITTDRLRGLKNFNLPQKLMNYEFYSGFQKVFLFDLVKTEIYRLI